MIHKYSVRTDLLFLLFAMLWGASYPITQSAISSIDPYLFVFLRFGLAALVMLPFIMKQFRTNLMPWVKIGIVLGLLNTAIYTFETLSLKYTSVSKSAFIMGSNVIIVPFLAQIFRISQLTLLEILSAVFFLLGLYILTGSHFNNINHGDVLALLGAVAIAFSITYLQHITRDDFNPILLTFFQLTFTCPIPIMLYLAKPAAPIVLSSGLIWAICFCGILATTLPLLGQIKFQKYTTAAQTASIFALEPIFACLFAYVFYNDAVTSEVILGGVIMLLSTMVPVVIKFLKEQRYKAKLGRIVN
jgi:drug/metabolite transporter (DMT)-like permease